MESHSPERKFEDRMNKNISIEDLRNENAKNILSLRKEKRNKDTILNIKGKLNSLNENHYCIHFNLLKTNNDEIRNFYIDLKNEQSTMDKIKYLLQSNDDNEVKYGLFAIRKFFVNTMRGLYYKEEEHSKFSKDEIKVCKELDIFINNNIIDLIFQIMNKSMNKNEKQYFINIYESIWIFINMTSAIPGDKNKQFEFYKRFLKEEYLNIFINIIKNNNIPQEIIINVLILLVNIGLQDNIFVDILINSSLIQVLFSYLKANKNINSDVLVYIYKILHLLCSKLNTFNNLDIEAYKTIFKIFSLPLYNFKNKDLLNYCLNILFLLSEKNNPEIEHFFSDINLFSAFNNIIFDDNKNIDDIEDIITLILDILYNLIQKENDELQTYINSGSFLIFYNNLLIKFKNEHKVINFKIEEDILASVNNLILFNHSNSIKYILGEGKEILYFFMERARSIYRNTRYLGTRSLLNILVDQENEIDINIIHEFVNIIIDTLNIDNFSNCFFTCLQAIILIINKSVKMNFKNELRIYLDQKGLINNLEKIENTLLNNPQNNEFNSEDENHYQNLINEIKAFLK